MAKKREFNVETITIDAQPAVNAIKKLDGTLASLKSTIKGVKQERQEALLAGDMESFGKLTKELEDLGAAYKNVRALQRNVVTEVKGINDVLANLSKATYNELIQLQGQLQRAIKSAEPETDDYKNLQDALRDVNARVEELKGTWKGLSEEAQKAAEAQRQAVVNDPTKASVDQLKEAIKLTEKLRDTKPIESSDYKQYNDELTKLKDTLKGAEQPMKNIALSGAEMRKVLKNLDEQPLEKLEQVAAQLEEELSKLAPNTRDFIRVSNNLKFVNGQIDEMKESWKEHDGQILATIKRLSAYVAVYGSYNFIAGKIKDMVSGWLQLSDTLADVQKTTGLAHKQLALLSKDIDAIDTRTTQEGMHQLAAVAGQIGLRSREDILGFVKASNQLTVALNELGDEGVQSFAKLATLTGDVRSMGIEKSMLAIGSSINELSANSSAAAGPIADFMRRVGGMANMANLSTADLAALGATADALGQPIEVAATAMNKFITTLVTKTDDVAYALNMDKEALKELIDSGDTVKAITQVLDAVRAKGDEGALAGIFKELGSEGARMQQVMMAMAENTRLMRQQITTSRDAFAEATSATEEYNVKNETAAAIVERIGNTVREFFITGERAQWLTKPLNRLFDIVKTLMGVSDAAAKVRGAFLALFVVLSSQKFWRGIVVSFQRLNTQIKAQTVGVVGLRKAWIALKTAMSGTNVVALAINVVIAAIAGVTAAMAGMRKQAEMTAEALEDLREQEQGEKKHLDELYNSMTDANITQEKRKELIQAFNDKYSDYLGYMIDETDSVEELTRAYELLNAQIELRWAKMLSAEYMKGPLEEYGREIRTATEEFSEGINYLNLATRMGVSEKTLTDAVRDLAKKFAEEGKTIDFFTWGSVEDSEFAKALKADERLLGARQDLLGQVVSTNRSAINDMIQAEVDLLDARKRANNEEKILVGEAETNFANKRKAAMDGLKAEVEGYAANSDSIKQMKEDEVQAIIDNGNTVLEYLKEQNSTEAEAFSAQLDVIRKIYAGDAWGKALNIQSLKEAFGNLQNLGTASVDNLVQTYKTLEDAGKRYTNTAEFNSIFGMDAQTIDEMHTFFKNYASQVKDRLKELGYTTAGNFDWSGEKGRSKKEKIKQEYQAALAALEAYYKEEETLIRKNGMANNLTETEIEHQLLENQEQFLKDRRELRKRMLAEDNNFDPSIYIGKITGTDYFKDKNLDLLAEQMKKWGQAMTDGIRLGLVEDMNEVEEQAWKVKQKVLEIVQDRAWHEKVDREMMASFEGINAFWGAEVEHTEENGKRILDAMKATAQYIYKEDTDTFKTRLENNAVFGEMYKNLTEEQQQAFLILLGDYHDKVIEADKKFADERKRVFAQAWKDSGYQETFDKAEEQLRNAQSNLDWYGNNDAIAYQRNFFDAQQEILSAQVALETWAHEQKMAIMEREGATQQMRMDEERSYMKTMQQLSEQMLENYKARYEKMASISTSYGDILGDGLVRMAFNEENAGKELIKSLLKTTVEMASQFAQRLVLQQTFGAAMQSIKAQQNAQEIAASYAAAMQEIGIEASKMAAIEAIVAGKVTAQSMALPDSIATYGAAGAGRAALIMGFVSAATAGALALIDNLFPGAATEAKAESAATAPKRKLTTGMLTYAEGKYPVLGNDGVVYDAEYAGSNMKTGVYRKPHFGIFAEKQPEMVIDGKTTQRLVLNYPEIYSGILELSRTGRMGMRTYAKGNVLEIGEGYDAQAHRAQQQMQMEEMRQTMAATAAALAALTRRLDQPIHAEMNYFGKGGAREAEQRGSRWATRNRVK